MRESCFHPDNGNRPGIPDVGVVMTDGESNRDGDLVFPESLKARNAGTIVTNNVLRGHPITLTFDIKLPS